MSAWDDPITHIRELEVEVERLRKVVDDGHCATCQCAGTECRERVWCKRTWGHVGACNVIRDEEFCR